MDLLEVYWREAMVGGLAFVTAALFLKTDRLRPVVTIFGATAIGIALNIEAPTLRAAKAVVAGVRDTILGQAGSLF